MIEYYNENTNVTLTEKEYIELVKREAIEAYKEYLEDLDEDEEAMTYEEMFNKLIESESDFRVIDEEYRES